MVTVIRNNFPEGDDRITNGNVIGSKYADYYQAIEIAKWLDSKGKIISAEFEDPDQQLIWHGCLIKANEFIELDKEELASVSELFECFDGLTSTTETDGTITLSFVSHIYE